MRLISMGIPKQLDCLRRFQNAEIIIYGEAQPPCIGAATAVGPAMLASIKVAETAQSMKGLG